MPYELSNETMKIKKHNILRTGFAMLLLCTSQCTWSQEPTWMHKSQWLVGTWEGTYKGEPFYEVWIKKNDSTLLNLGIELKGKDTLVNFLGELKQTGETLMYGGRRIKWNLTRLMDNELVLTNDTLLSSHTIIWFHTADDHWWTLLQNKESTNYYDIVRSSRFQSYVERKKDKWIK